MKKLLILLCIACIALGAYIYLSKKTMPLSPNSYAIAIFTPVTHPALEEIEQGFKETMEKAPGHYSFITFNANGNKTLQRAQAEEIMNEKFDAVLTIGASCTQLAFEVAKKKENKTPLIFCAVDDPVSMGIINSLASSGNQLTGVIEFTDYRKQLSLLKLIKPDTKKILLVYDPTHGTGLEKDKAEIQAILDQLGIQLQAVEIYQAQEISQKVPGLLAGVDVILVLKDNTIVAGIDGLITLARRHGITLLASDLNSGKKGAALAYGFTEYDSGAQAALKAIKIINEHVSPAAIPITAVPDIKMVVNKEAMHDQNIELTSDMLERIEHGNL
jgi:putative tryptophan/tyrosine transport system substrate-binding protein